MANKEIKFEVPALSQKDLAENAALITENRQLLSKIINDLDLLTEDDRKLGLNQGRLDLGVVLTPKSYDSLDNKGLITEAAFVIYVIRIVHHRADGQTVGSAKTIVVTGDGQIGHVPSTIECSGNSTFEIEITLDQHRRIFYAYPSVRQVYVRVGDYIETYEAEDTFRKPLKVQVEHLRRIAAALPK